ncbi:MAG: hypothetical protein J6L76_03900 [Clostridia bacterium]|nr:hypothetical protein [Clostridia bacterium]
MNDVDICVCCGVPVPEGRMICPNCESDQQTSKEETEAFFEKLSESLAQKNDK